MRAFTCPVCRHLVTFENTHCLNCGTVLGFDWEAAEVRRRSAGVREPRADRLQRRRRRAGCAALRADPHAPARRGAGAVRGRRGGQAAAGLRAARARPADRRRPDASTCSRARAGRSPPATPTASSRSTWPRPTPSTASGPAPSSTSPTAPCSGTCATRSATTTSRSSARGSPTIGRCRALFGDDREDYSAALDRHYASGPPADWPRALRLRLRDDAPVGGLGGDVRPLPAHPRRPADRDRLRRHRHRPGRARRRRRAAVLLPGRRPDATSARCSTPGSR